MQMALCASHRQQVLCAAMVGSWKAMLRTVPSTAMMGQDGMTEKCIKNSEY